MAWCTGPARRSAGWGEGGNGGLAGETEGRLVDWSNEEYVRLYTRETADDLELGWEALALWRAMLTKFDRAGLIRARNGWRSVAALVRMPVDVVERVGPDLLTDGRVRKVDDGFYAPNFTEAQTATKSDKARQRESRDRRREQAESQFVTKRDTESRNVTESHAASHVVTSGHAASQNVTLASAEPLLKLRDAEALLIPRDAKAPAKQKRKARSALPADWEPSDAERARAAERNLNCAGEAERFRNHHTAKGSLMADWDAAFRMWLSNAERFAPQRPQRDGLAHALAIANGEA